MLTEVFHVHAGALDWREGYRWDLFLAVLQCPHLPPGCPGGPAAQPEKGRERLRLAAVLFLQMLGSLQASLTY